MILFKNILKVILIPNLFLFFSCDFNLDSIIDSSNESGEEAGVETRYFWDESTDTNFYYEDDILIWKEVYDYDDNNQCIFKRRLTSSEETLFSYIYTWENGKTTESAYFDSSNELSTFEVYKWDEDNMVSRFKYDSNSTLLWAKNYTYNSNNKLIQTIYINDSGEVIWITTSQWDGDRVIESSRLDDNSGIRTGYIEYQYDSSDRNYLTTGYGNAKTTDSYIDSPPGFSFKETKGINKEIRNSEGLIAPDIPVLIEIQNVTTGSNSLDYAWMKLKEWDEWGSSYVVMNSDNLPTYMERVSEEYLGDNPVSIEISYIEDNKIKSKTTSYGDITLLKLEFEYNSDGFPTSIATSGEVVLLPLTYRLNFNPENDEDIGISIYSNDTMLQKFIYVFNDSVNREELLYSDFSENIAYIENYDGDNKLIGTYNFNYQQNSETQNYDLIIDMVDSSNLSKQKIIIAYDSNYNTSSIKCYDQDNQVSWNYSYNYDELGNRISEIKLNAENVPELISGFDIETLFEDIKRYLPIEIPAF